MLNVIILQIGFDTNNLAYISIFLCYRSEKTLNTARERSVSRLSERELIMLLIDPRTRY